MEGEDKNVCQRQFTNQEILYCVQDDLAGLRRTYEKQIKQLEEQILNLHGQLSKLHFVLKNQEKYMTNKFFNIIEEKLGKTIAAETEDKLSENSESVKEKWHNLAED